jgi:hypothetical protein
MTLTNLTTAIAAVTEEQIDRCTRIYDLNNNVPFYLVRSESDDLTEYKVTWSKELGFQCTCAAGQEGFCHCYKNGVCKHVVWSVAAAAQFHKDEVAEQSAITSLMGSGVSRETATALAYSTLPVECEQDTVIDTAWAHEQAQAAARERKATKRRGSRAYESNTFSLLK